MSKYNKITALYSRFGDTSDTLIGFGAVVGTDYRRGDKSFSLPIVPGFPSS